MTNKTETLTANENAAIVVLIKSCLDGMGGKVRSDLDGDPFTWVDVPMLMAHGWTKNSAQGTFASLVDRGIIGEMDKNEWAIAYDHPLVIAACDNAIGDALDAAYIEDAPAPASNRVTCEELRAEAVAWEGTRKSFIDAMVARGANKATAATQWQRGRK